MATKSIISKMPLYDIVTLVIPSAMVCYAHNWIPVECKVSWVVYVAQFGAILIFGFILKSISNWWGSLWFRNNTDVIKQERLKVENIGGENKSCRFLDILIFDPLKYICSIVMYFCYSADSHELLDYYEKYEEAYEKSYSGKRIDILESHVAFLQTTILALFICIFGNMYSSCICECGSRFAWEPCVVLAVCYMCVVIMLNIQRTIYRIVFENSKDK
jgi:hypothetical protein